MAYWGQNRVTVAIIECYPSICDRKSVTTIIHNIIDKLKTTQSEHHGKQRMTGNHGIIDHLLNVIGSIYWISDSNLNY